MKINEILKVFKNKHIRVLGVIFIIGIVLMLSVGEKPKNKAEEVKESISTLSDEERLEDILSEIDGAGDVSVMITYYGTAEKDIAYETKTNKSGNEERNEESEDKKAVMRDGEPMIVKEIYPKVKGVIVAANGANSITVRQAIIEAVTAVMDVPTHRVCIYKKAD